MTCLGPPWENFQGKIAEQIATGNEDALLDQARSDDLANSRLG
jgi:hypothetical protein